MKREGKVTAGAILEIIEGAIFLMINAWVVVFIDKFVQAFNLKAYITVIVACILILIPLAMIYGSAMVIAGKYKSKKDLMSNGIANLAFCAFFIFISFRAALLIYFIPIVLGIISACFYFSAKCESKTQYQSNQTVVPQSNVNSIQTENIQEAYVENNSEEIVSSNYQVIDTKKASRSKKLSKKAYATILVGVIVVALLCVFLVPNLISSDGAKDFEYKKRSSGLIEITKYTGTEHVVEIPEEIKGIKVVSIADNAFYANDTIEDIIIPDSIITIGSHAFYGCYRLKNVIIPKNVISIGKGAFEDCYSIESITLPFIGEEANGGESSPSSIFGHIFGASSYHNYHNVLPDGLDTVIVTGDFEIYDGAFYGCDGIQNIVLPSMKNVSLGAFTNCNNIKIYCQESKQESEFSDEWDNTDYTIYWAPQIEKDEQGLWYVVANGQAAVTSYCDGRESWREIKIPAQINGCPVVAIGEKAFSGTDVNKIIFEDNSKITTIKKDAFLNCEPVIKDVYITNLSAWCKTTFENYYSNPANCSLLYLNGDLMEELVIPSDVTEISAYAFTCQNIKSIQISNNVTKIGENALKGSSWLTSIIIPSSVTNMGRCQFSNGLSDSFIIYCEALSKPSGWDNEWNYWNHQVVWGYQG